MLFVQSIFVVSKKLVSRTIFVLKSLCVSKSYSTDDISEDISIKTAKKRDYSILILYDSVFVEVEN